MTQPESKDICRVMAENIFKELENIGFYYGSEELAGIIRNHTIVPEMVRATQALLKQFEKWEGYHEWDEEDEILVKTTHILLAKAEPEKGEHHE